MSLINDALKRAQESQRPSQSAATMAPLRPVERLVKPRRNWGWMLPLAVICLIAAAFLFIGLALANHSVKPLAVAPEIPQPTPETPSVATVRSVLAANSAAPKAAPVPAPAPVAAAAEPNVAQLPVIGPAAIASGNPDVTPVKPPKPPLVIQGIVNDPVRPWAIISGRTLYVGDSVRGLRVTAITRNSVTLVGDGETNRLVVGQEQ
jgi:hypothetical protein